MLLSEKNRNAYLKALGFKSVLDFEKVAFPNNKKEQDGIYGKNTDNALRTFYNVKKYAPNFSPKEFRCSCGRCCGYPTYMHKEVLQGLQAFRTKYGKPITVTCGLRCADFNRRLNGSSANSKHLTGYAVDFYQKGVTDTLANRKSAIKYAKTLKGINYAYGNGWCIYNYKVNTPNMGNAMHIDFKYVKPKVKTPNSKCIDAVVDWGVKISKDNKYKYKKWTSDKKTHQCPICHKGSGNGWNCIGFVSAAFYHGGGVKDVPCKCNGIVTGGGTYKDWTLSKFKARNGNDWTEVKGTTWRKGDVIICFDKKTEAYKHTALGYKARYVIDATSTYGIAIRHKSFSSYLLRIYRYTGRGKY